MSLVGTSDNKQAVNSGAGLARKKLRQELEKDNVAFIVSEFYK